MGPEGEATLAAIDVALRRMRRVIELPEAVKDQGRRVDGSTLLVLEALLGAGATTIRDVSEELDVAHSTASRLVARAEAAGMVTRGPSSVSGRETHVRATARGAEVRERGLQFRIERLQEFTAGWTPKEREAFAVLLARFAAASRSQPRPDDADDTPSGA